MNKNLLRFSALAFAFVACVIMPFVAYAGIIDPLNEGDMKSPVTTGSQVVTILLSAIKWLYTLFFVAALVFILLSAYTFIMARGDEKKIINAKAQLKYAAVGIAVALLASGASLLIKNVLIDLNSGTAALTGDKGSTETPIL